jgi:hypothetical protein
MAQLCRRCPLRQACLTSALAGLEQGYWAGTTARDRESLSTLDRGDTDTADWLQELARRDDTKGALHAPGEGKHTWYRRGCRCGECRHANATTRAQERAKAQAKSGSMAMSSTVIASTDPHEVASSGHGTQEQVGLASVDI